MGGEPPGYLQHDRGVQLGSTSKQLQLSGQSGISSSVLKPFGHAATIQLF